MTTTEHTGPSAATQDPESTTGPSVVVSDLHQHYGEFEAVRGVSFEIRPGELFALLGTNGAGKTTTIETLEGFRRPSSGTIRVFGQDPFGQPPGVRERVNAVLQGSGLLEDLSVDESLRLTSDLAASPRDVEEILHLVNLTDKRGLRVRQLSGGQKRRLDLGSALLTRPEVLYLDEPTTGMDPEARHETWRIINDLKESGVAVLLTTHYLEEAERLADRLAIMHRGEIRVEGTLAGVLAGWGDRVSFLLPGDVRTADLPDVDGATIEVETRGQELWATYTVTGGDVAERAHRAVAALVAWSAEQGAVLQHLQVRGASLEDVFLQVADGASDLVTP
ncbi:MULTISPECIES: ABC transporter ATP-binding protein [unclassified Nocardiopsis]|uniref:ABC transporter ATP-binding protein n=1 Tax=unclassified Nocardiopsis TaxID=2649073 RepID=UPI00066D8651|nr:MULTISPECIES: ABC transporter ATP-binding protein [unclassified Nocardiopsis]MBQ1082128.1 ABC transporter ATP-binding protein [Nocardiopsis sp. B62]